MNGTYAKLFLSTFQLSACTFGGGFVIIPLMRKKFVEELGWIEEQEMMDLTAIAQSSPGAIAVNASILVGYHTSMWRNAMRSMTFLIKPASSLCDMRCRKPLHLLPVSASSGRVRCARRSAEAALISPSAGAAANGTGRSTERIITVLPSKPSLPMPFPVCRKWLAPQ